MCATCRAHQEAVDALTNTVSIIRELPDPDMRGKCHMELINEIPGGYPDGTGILTPVGWVRWAKKKLGYSG